MFKEIDADCYLTIDSDDIYPKENVIEMTIHALDKKFLLKEIPVEYRDCPAGSVSKLNTFSDGFKVLKTIARLFK